MFNRNKRGIGAPPVSGERRAPPPPASFSFFFFLCSLLLCGFLNSKADGSCTGTKPIPGGAFVLWFLERISAAQIHLWIVTCRIGFCHLFVALWTWLYSDRRGKEWVLETTLTEINIRASLMRIGIRAPNPWPTPLLSLCAHLTSFTHARRSRNLNVCALD